MKNTARQNSILRLLARSRELSVSYLAEALDVSQPTVRRDLQYMEDCGLLTRIHGGATLEGISRTEPLFEDKQDRRPQAKEAIALTALELIDDGDRIYLDGGSTVLALARHLDRKRRLTIVTNSFMAASELMNTEHRLILVGGEFRALSRTLIGPLTAPVINSLRVDKAFMGTIGFSVDEGMTTTDPGEAFTKEQIMQRAGQVILLADSTKIGVPSFARSGRSEDIDVLITETADEDMRRALGPVGVTLRVAKPLMTDPSLSNATKTKD